MIVEYTIEGWTFNPYTDEIELPDEDFEGMTDEERTREIEEIVTDAVNNVVSWGWHIK